MSSTLDTDVRIRLYRDFVRDGRAPSAEQLGARMQLPVAEIRAAWERLAAGKAIVLQPESREILMANPLCAVATPYLVRWEGRDFFASCVWDGLGIIAMLKVDAAVESSCACCGEALTIAIREGVPVLQDGIIHFAIPAKRWWDNIVFT
jgi:hypothetical protein